MSGFRESRSLRESWVGWLVLGGGSMALISGLTVTLPHVHEIIEAGKMYTDLILPLCVTIAVFAFCLFLFLTMRLEITIDATGIRFSSRPFIRKTGYSWSEIAYAWVRQYRALGEYGGWGYRGIGKRRRAFTMGEKYGIQIVTNDGRDILLGTARPEVAAEALRLAGKGKQPAYGWSMNRLGFFLKKLKGE